MAGLVADLITLKQCCPGVVSLQRPPRRQQVLCHLRRPAVAAIPVVCRRLEDGGSRRPVAVWSSAEGGVAEAIDSEAEEDLANIREIQRVLELLRKKRDMSPSEVKLTIMIEDPREVERRRELGVEDERGCSREDLGNALGEVIQGKIPADRIVLRELTKEMQSWPNLEQEESKGAGPGVSLYAKLTNTGVDPTIARAQAEWDAASEIGPGEESKNLSEILPPAVGISVLYLVSGIPIVIGVVVVAILFVNSLQ